ncbi:MAG: signal transduction histidine kinase/CheY-like chemotaxis protein, partial [Phenylobacterium sp.]
FSIEPLGDYCICNPEPHLFDQSPNLPAGDYTLQIKASNKDGYWTVQGQAGQEGKSLNITVLPPPWKTWWAYSIYSVLLLALTGAFIRAQQTKIRTEQALNLRLTQVDKLKDEFLANTSHELRTPLNGIIGLAESLIDGIAGPLPDNANYNLAMVVASGKRLANLVNDILDFSKLKNRNLVLVTRPVDLHSLAEVVLALSGPLLGRINGIEPLQLINAIDKDLPAAMADENRLQQILHNLVGNAIKFTDSGSVTLSAEVSHNGLTISVSDTGIGIEASQFKAIFDSFEQLEGHSERNGSGTGLGLAVSKQLVELHGGSIWLESQPGQGSTFSFTLPTSGQQATTSNDKSSSQSVSRLHMLEQDQPRQPVSLPPVPSGKAPQVPDAIDGQRFRLLLVDDEPVNRLVLKNLLSLQHYQLVEADGGESALAALRDDGPFDLVILDIMMPKVSGYEVCRQLRESWSVNDLPVLFLTAKNQVGDLVESFAMGGNDYLTKPVAKNELLARVETHLKLLDINRNLEHKVGERTAQLEQSYKQIRTIRTLGLQINQSLKLDDVLDSIYQRVNGLMDVSIFAIGLCGSGTDNSQIEVKFAIENEVLFEPYTLDPQDKKHFAVWCIEHKAPVFINDIQNEGEQYISDHPWLGGDKYQQAIEDNQSPQVPQSVIYIPILIKQKVLGFLTVQSFQPQAFKPIDLEVLTSLTNYIATAIDNAQVHLDLLDSQRKVLQMDNQRQLAEAEKMASLGTLTAGVAHEINNPANFVRISAQNLEVDLEEFQKFLFELAGDDASEAILDSFRDNLKPLYGHVNTILDGTDRIKVIVQDLRTFTQLDPIEQTTINIGQKLQSTINLVKTQYIETIQFITEFDDETHLRCHPAQLNQVIMNLIVNACDAIGEKQQAQQAEQAAYFSSRSLPVKPTGKVRGRIVIGCHIVGNGIEISVKDNGNGMSEQTQKRLFEPFYTTKGPDKGTGLGLSISYGIVQKHGGELSVESEVGVGTRFLLRFPIKTA